MEKISKEKIKKIEVVNEDISLIEEKYRKKIINIQTNKYIFEHIFMQVKNDIKVIILAEDNTSTKNCKYRNNFNAFKNFDWNIEKLAEITGINQLDVMEDFLPILSKYENMDEILTSLGSSRKSKNKSVPNIREIAHNNSLKKQQRAY